MYEIVIILELNKLLPLLMKLYSDDPYSKNGAVANG